MATATTDPTMADDKLKTQPIRLMADVVESARIVSAYRNEPMAEMLSDILRPILAKLEKEAVARRGKKEKDGR